jgi:hypothetical protein
MAIKSIIKLFGYLENVPKTLNLCLNLENVFKCFYDLEKALPDNADDRSVLRMKGNLRMKATNCFNDSR